MNKILDIAKFLEYSKQYNIVDVRSPIEFKRGHIPGACNIPLFSDPERHELGIYYKKYGKDKAILKGLDFIGPKMRPMVEQVAKIAPDKTIMLHCWRGGMRSSSVAWLLNFCGYKTFLLAGGYKGFRHYVLQQLAIPYKLILLGGKTGSGKTHLLHAIAANGEQVLDLEAIAYHKGSAFGGYEQPLSLTQEHFENLLFWQLREVNPEKFLWFEDESRVLGKVHIPEELWKNMRKSAVIFLEVPVNTRVNNILADYGDYDTEKLKASILQLNKRLGGLNTQRAFEFVENGQLDQACAILLQYYDKAYLHGLSKRTEGRIDYLELKKTEYESNARQIIEFSENIRNDHVSQYV